MGGEHQQGRRGQGRLPGAMLQGVLSPTCWLLGYTHLVRAGSSLVNLFPSTVKDNPINFLGHCNNLTRTLCHENNRNIFCILKVRSLESKHQRAWADVVCICNVNLPSASLIGVLRVAFGSHQDTPRGAYLAVLSTITSAKTPFPNKLA